MTSTPCGCTLYVGQRTGATTVRLRDGTTCEIESGPWTLTADVPAEKGGNGAGPSPAVLERGALGSCLAITYTIWAAKLDVPIDHLEVEVEADFDARGFLGVTDVVPGMTSLRYRVTIESPAPEADVRQVLEEAEARSPTYDDFSRALSMEREVHIATPSSPASASWTWPAARAW